MAPQIQFSEATSGITEVPGFKVGAAACDIRKKDNLERLDVAVIVSDKPCTAAGTFTTNDLRAAPVLLCMEHLNARETHHAIVINSGNANACTGEQGKVDADAMAGQLARLTGLFKEEVFVCSTGRIGELLPMDRVAQGISGAVGNLSTQASEGTRVATAILTSDTRPKVATATFEVGSKQITISGIAKGAGMIEPNMATMLAFVVTDADCLKGLLGELLQQAVGASFNRITVDGDMSTNDTVLLLANGVSGVVISKDDAAVYEAFKAALTQVCLSLAKKIVGDGERITKVVQLTVKGAATQEAAEKAARAVANSLLVKSSWFGSDPNWGRLAHAVGYAKIGLQESKLDIYYDDVPALLAGKPQSELKPQWKAIVARKEFSITINLNLGEYEATLYSTDLSTGYVDFNKSE